MGFAGSVEVRDEVQKISYYDKGDWERREWKPKNTYDKHVGDRETWRGESYEN